MDHMRISGTENNLSLGMIIILTKILAVVIQK